MFEKFWAWYERAYVFNISLAFGLFVLQLIHLVWLTGDVVWPSLFSEDLFHIHGGPELLIVLVDYTEIPVLISVSLIYINELRKVWNYTSVLYLVFLNSQWLHLFWITDEFVVDAFSGGAWTVLPVWLAWVAIMIDYLEVPVMLDTARKFFSGIAKENATQ
jgi:hypothetical protein